MFEVTQRWSQQSLLASSQEDFFTSWPICGKIKKKGNVLLKYSVSLRLHKSSVHGRRPMGQQNVTSLDDDETTIVYENAFQLTLMTLFNGQRDE